MKKEDALDAALGLVEVVPTNFGPLPEIPKGELMVRKSTEVSVEYTETETADEKDQKNDYNKSRNTFKVLIDHGEKAIEELEFIAKDTEAPRAYEVLANLMKTTADITNNLYDLHQKKKNLANSGFPKTNGENTDINIEKAVFVGTTTDLLDIVKKEQSDKIATGV